MQKRLLICLVLSIAFMTVWNMWLTSMGYNKRPAPKPKAAEEQVVREDGASTPSPEPGLSEAAPADEAAAVEAEEVVAQRTDILENAAIKLVFDNRGGVIRDAVLKNFHATVKGNDPIHLVFARNLYPGTLVFDDQLTDASWVYKVEVSENALIYRYTRGGASVVKTYKLDKEFLLHADVSYEGAASKNFHFVVGEGLQPIGPGEKVKPSMLDMGAAHPKMMEVTWSQDGSNKSTILEKGNRDRFEPKLKEESSIDWMGIKDNYFANVFLPDQPVKNLYTRIADVRPGQTVIPLPAVALRAESTLSGKFYMGPMIEEHLLAADARLDDLITYGWAGMLSKYLFVGLKLCHNLTGNWGWAIVLLTICIRLVMVPLTIPQVKSSIKMRKLQPEIEKIKAKYSGQDLETKQKLSQATFALYKQEGINPFSSCLTALAQMPVFFAYFSLLRSSISLRQAEWIGWIHDLSVNDPTFILSILMGVTMFLSTLAMPMPSSDPLQAKMMKIMPLAFSVMFIFMPAGLILYMITSNLFTLSQTKFLQWRYERLAE